MRYCPHCRRLNPGRPMICHYCGRTWYVRLCPRHHENPANAQFCGQCGSADLTETAGPRPWGLYFIKIMILVVLCFVLLLIGKLFLSLKAEIFPILIKEMIVIILLIAGYTIALSVLPSPIRKILTKVNRYLFKSMVKALAWFGRMIKEFINLMLNW